MRQRKAKDLDMRLSACRDFLCETPPDITGLCVEIGCGKGQFIIKKAAGNPEKMFLGIEGQDTVLLRAAEKAMAVSGKINWPENVPGEERMNGISSPLSNLKFKKCFVEDMSELFKENQLSAVYLNFSDPWPKARHAKRRLTHHKRLADYAWAIASGGLIEIKTDNDNLFEFTLEEIKFYNGEGHAKTPKLEIAEITQDLHEVLIAPQKFGSESEADEKSVKYEAALTTTEYEDKFCGRGKNINYVKLIVNK